MDKAADTAATSKVLKDTQIAEASHVHAQSNKSLTQGACDHVLSRDVGLGAMERRQGPA